MTPTQTLFISQALQQAHATLGKLDYYPSLFATIGGSHLFGFANIESDLDVWGIYVLPMCDVAGLIKGPGHIDTKIDSFDITLYDIEKFCQLLLNKNGNMLEMIYSPLVLHTSSNHQELKYLASLCITKHSAKHYSGFAQKQWKLIQKEAQRERKGVKSLLYLYRVMLTGIHLLQTGRVESNLLTLTKIFHLPSILDLIARKQAGDDTLEEEEVSATRKKYETLLDMLDASFATTQLPEKVSEETRQALHHFILKVRA